MTTDTLTKVILSYCRAYQTQARRIGEDLRSAGIEVVYDPWQGGGGGPGSPLLFRSLARIHCLLPLLTPSEATPSWIGPEWLQVRFQPAFEQRLAILPIKGAGDASAVPTCLNDLSFANLSGPDYPLELQRLLQTIRDRTGDLRVGLPPEQPLSDAFGGHPALQMRVGKQLAMFLELEAEQTPYLREQLPLMYDGLFYETGLYFPALELKSDDSLANNVAQILINGVPESEEAVQIDRVLIDEDCGSLDKFGVAGLRACNPATANPCCWIFAEQTGLLPNAEYLTIWTPGEFLILMLSAALRRRAADYVEIEQTQLLLDGAALAYPQLVADVLHCLPLLTITDVLRRLAAEGVSVRNLRRILMALLRWAPVESDPLLLAEYARSALQRQLVHMHSRGTRRLVVLLLEPKIEDLIFRAFRHLPTGSYVDLPAETLQALLMAIEEPIAALPTGAQLPIILTKSAVRAAMRRLVATRFPRLHVLSYQELRPDTAIQPLGRIGLEGFESRPGISVAGSPIW